MLQFAGLAAILNEINPGLGDKIASKFNNSITDRVSEHLAEPISKSYKYGFANGLFAGILLTVATYKIVKKIQSKTSANSNI